MRLMPPRGWNDRILALFASVPLRGGSNDRKTAAYAGGPGRRSARRRARAAGAGYRADAVIDQRVAPYAALALGLSLAGFFFAHVYRKFAIIGFATWWARPGRARARHSFSHYTSAAASPAALPLVLR